MSSTINLVATIDTPSASPSTASVALFPNLVQLSFARPETLLSKGCAISLPEEEDLIHAWAQSLFIHFPLLEQLEAWGDYAGRSQSSMSYFLPMEDILEATWEFLSGVEQSLWHDEDDQDTDVFSPASFGPASFGPASFGPASFGQDAYVISPGPFERLVVSDWEMASQMEAFSAR